MPHPDPVQNLPSAVRNQSENGFLENPAHLDESLSDRCTSPTPQQLAYSDAPVRFQLRRRDSVEPLAIVVDCARGGSQKPHDGAGHRRLPATALSYETKRLVAAHLQCDAVDRLDRLPAPPLLSRSSRSSSMISAWIMTSSAVVGSSAMMIMGFVISAVATVTRWRMPPEMKYGLGRAFRWPACASPNLALRDLTWFADEVQDRERRHRFPPRFCP